MKIMRERIGRLVGSVVVAGALMFTSPVLANSAQGAEDRMCMPEGYSYRLGGEEYHVFPEMDIVGMPSQLYVFEPMVIYGKRS